MCPGVNSFIFTAISVKDVCDSTAKDFLSMRNVNSGADIEKQ